MWLASLLTLDPPSEYVPLLFFKNMCHLLASGDSELKEKLTKLSTSNGSLPLFSAIMTYTVLAKPLYTGSNLIPESKSELKRVEQHNGSGPCRICVHFLSKCLQPSQFYYFIFNYCCSLSQSWVENPDWVQPIIKKSKAPVKISDLPRSHHF